MDHENENYAYKPRAIDSLINVALFMLGSSLLVVSLTPPPPEVGSITPVLLRLSGLLLIAIDVADIFLSPKN